MCRPSSREMSSLEKVSPGMSRRFLSQKMAQKEPLKWMPSTQAKATRRSAKRTPLPIHCCAQARLLGHAWQRLGRLRRKHGPFYLCGEQVQQERYKLQLSI